MNVHWRESTNENEGKPEQKFDVAFGTIFGIIIFKEAGRNCINLSLKQGRLKIKNHLSIGGFRKY
jgi:hypothetical protein